MGFPVNTMEKENEHVVFPVVKLVPKQVVHEMLKYYLQSRQQRKFEDNQATSKEKGKRRKREEGIGEIRISE